MTVVPIHAPPCTLTRCNHMRCVDTSPAPLFVLLRYDMPLPAVLSLTAHSWRHTVPTVRTLPIVCTLALLRIGRTLRELHPNVLNTCSAGVYVTSSRIGRA